VKWDDYQDGDDSENDDSNDVAVTVQASNLWTMRIQTAMQSAMAIRIMMTVRGER
jgi:hypothetical protein